MPKRKFTAKFVEHLKPPPHGKQRDYYDTMNGLVLRVNYGGRKTWRVLYTVKTLMTDAEIAKTDERARKRAEEQGREFKPKEGPRYHTEPRTRPLGHYPKMTLAEARAKAKLFDPKKPVETDGETFNQVAESFIKRHVDANQLRTSPEIKRCLAKYIIPRWGALPFRGIKRTDVTKLLDEIEDQIEEQHQKRQDGKGKQHIKARDGKGQADYCLSIIRKMMNWYASRNDEYATPIVRGMGRRNIAQSARTRILADEEIRLVWKACSEMGTFGALVKMLLLTAQRLRKTAAMKWEHVTDGAWHIPSEKGEKGHAGVLKLPPLALAIINAQPRVADNPYVFVAERGHGDWYNSFSHGKLALNKRLPETMPPWVLHDLRRTARSLMSRAGVRPDISERVLGHVIVGVEGIYDRHHYSQEKADALIRLARLIETILNPVKGNVVELRSRSKHRR